MADSALRQDEEIIEEDILDEELEDEEDEESEDKEETARETVERILKEAEEQGDGNVEEEATPQTKPKEQTKPVDEPATIPDQPVVPPSRLDANSKAIFSKLPKDLQAQWAKIHKDEEARFTKTQQEFSKATREANHIVQAVRPYLLANPRLAEQGFTESSLVSSLIATHQQLTNDTTKLQTWLNIGKQIGIEDADIQQIREAYQGQQPTAKQPPQVNPQNDAMQRELDQLKSELVQQKSAPIVKEMEAVRNEKDATTGNFLFPELFDAAFLERAKPLVSALVETVPELSYGEALKRAHSQLTGRSIPQGNFNQQNQTKLPNNNNAPARAVSAAVSVRGKSAPVSFGETLDIPKEALTNDPRDSVRWALNALRKGN